ncbi:putative quinol monooxygenase [Nocardioides campestrisoli]|uniref:putative quinol monooxygenase n=1 Tax=Nocardioides campestrisoli TaxID=2736757 RepID=UPI00163D6087|nr:putative quinol monooxygenase [Nocardioides campestrisoli]
MINVVATLSTKPGSGATLEAAVAEARSTVLANPRCSRYDLQQKRRSQTDYVMLEAWESTEALKEHTGSEAFKRLGGTLAEVLAGAPEILVLDPVGEQVPLA